ncbi:MAG: phosphotransferase [Nitrospirae bacterium]|nr:phosphotransferase [Nitrospirota bacterium]
MIEDVHFENYLIGKFGDVKLIELKRLGEGVHGTGFSAVIKSPKGAITCVIKELGHEGLGHINPSDRAGVFLLAFDEYGSLPNHVKAIDVLSLQGDGSIKSIAGGLEYFLLMEMATGESYFTDIEAMKTKAALDQTDIRKIKAMASYLSKIHNIKKDSKMDYYRKLRDTIGHGECIMGVFDSYPDGTLSFREMAELEKKCIDWRVRLKPLYKRLCVIHGDFHPGNILFSSPEEFILLDRSRGPYGDAADDVTALTINYVFSSITQSGIINGPYKDALMLFYKEYLRLSGDMEILKVVPFFYAFRAVVVANPIFYPATDKPQRDAIFRFTHNVLDDTEFDYENAGKYL